MKIEFIIYALVLNFVLFYNYKYLSNKINIFDYPDKIRKFHKKKTPLVGGVFLMFVILLLCLISLINQDINFFFNYQFTNIKNLLIFLLIVTFFFILGIIDDKFNLAASQKIIYLMILGYLVLISNDNFLIKSLRFESFKKEIDLFQYSYFFSILAIVIFVNSMNMYDGINLQSSSYFLILYIFFLFINFSMLNVSIVLFLLFFIFFNSKGKIFLGDSGIYILSLLASITLMYLYNINKLFVEDILVFILIPILDFFRLIFLRIYKNKNPMIGDRLHVHHLMIKKYKDYNTVFLLNFLFICSLISHYIISLNIVITLTLSLIGYFLFIKKK